MDLGTVMLGVFAMIGFFTAGTVVAWFRNDPQVIAIGIPAMRAQCLALFFVPFSVCNNMMFQSIGYKLNATFLSTLRNGLCFYSAYSHHAVCIWNCGSAVCTGSSG